MDASPREPTGGRDRLPWKARPHLASSRSLLTASLATGDVESIYRVPLIGVFLIRITGTSRGHAPAGCWRVDDGIGGGRVTVGSWQDPEGCRELAVAPTTTEGALTA